MSKKLKLYDKTASRKLALKKWNKDQFGFREHKIIETIIPIEYIRNQEPTIYNRAKEQELDQNLNNLKLRNELIMVQIPYWLCKKKFLVYM